MSDLKKEKKDTENYNEKTLLKEHSKAIKSFLWMFIGVTIMLSIVYLIVPEAKLFEAQTRQ